MNVNKIIILCPFESLTIYNKYCNTIAAYFDGSDFITQYEDWSKTTLSIAQQDVGFRSMTDDKTNSYTTDSCNSTVNSMVIQSEIIIKTPNEAQNQKKKKQTVINRLCSVN